MVIMVGIIFIVIWSAKTLVRTDSGVRSRDSESETGTPTIRAGVSRECHTGVVTVFTSPRLREDLTSVTNMMETHYRAFVQ